MNKRIKKFVILLLCVACIANLIACSGSNIEKKLPGSWDNGFNILTIYSDGTYEDSGSYGTGTWTVLDGNVLKLTDFYGETTTYQIENVSSDSITLKNGSVWENTQ